MNPLHERDLLTGLFCCWLFFPPLSPIHIDQLLSLAELQEAVQGLLAGPVAMGKGEMALSWKRVGLDEV